MKMKCEAIGGGFSDSSAAIAPRDNLCAYHCEKMAVTK